MATKFIVETREAKTSERGAGSWHSDGIGSNEPRSRAECEEFIAWACSPACDWRNDGGAPHEYRITEVDADERVVRYHAETQRRDDGAVIQ